MAAPTNTYSSYDSPINTGRNAEDISDEVYNSDPVGTPVMDAARKITATGTNHEWFYDRLDAAGSNATIEGDDVAGEQLNDGDRIGNYLQLFDKSITISDTQLAVKKGGGITDELAYQADKKIRSLQRDVERAILTSNAKVAGNKTTAREMGSLDSYMVAATFSKQGASTVPTGDGTKVSDGAGTDVKITHKIVSDAIGEMYDEMDSEVADLMLVCGKDLRSAIDGFSQPTATSTRFVTTDDATLTTAIKVIETGLGDVTVYPDRHCQAGYVFLISPDMIALADLIPPNMFELARTGHAEKRAIQWETTLEVSDPYSHHCIIDLKAS